VNPQPAEPYYPLADLDRALAAPAMRPLAGPQDAGHAAQSRLLHETAVAPRSRSWPIAVVAAGVVGHRNMDVLHAADPSRRLAADGGEDPSGMAAGTRVPVQLDVCLLDRVDQLVVRLRRP